ncbi:protein of unassigned function [Methylobacterium oryzae CBMB20]|uniref:Protein of unassigned function n=1 Tax=Methylobacterium oryzae CBMB20 TaxID=693986 RepID=A0A089P1J2_9HYPH|nr:protein of unassigned function [Methylobacterium oryzae CBMB20]
MLFRGARRGPDRTCRPIGRICRVSALAALESRAKSRYRRPVQPGSFRAGGCGPSR